MKKIIFGLLMMGSVTSFAEEQVVCSKIMMGRTYRAFVNIGGSTATVQIASSKNFLTDRGVQSEGPVAYQVFGAVSAQAVGDVSSVIMDSPLSDPHSGEHQLDYAELRKNAEGTILFLKGRALPYFNRIRFKACN